VQLSQKQLLLKCGNIKSLHSSDLLSFRKRKFLEKSKKTMGAELRSVYRDNHIHHNPSIAHRTLSRASSGNHNPSIAHRTLSRASSGNHNPSIAQWLERLAVE
jgi:hypothetical protein